MLAAADAVTQALYNVLLNAVEAVEPNGFVGITASPLELSQEDLRNSPRAVPGPFVRITISDNGPGVAPEILPHALEPFVTNKPDHRGLGLSEAYGIVTSYDGLFEISSLPARGTTVHLYFPIKAAEEKQPATPGSAARGVVLLVAENEDLLTGASLILEDAGFEFISASSPDEGMDLFTRYHEDIDVVLLDEDLSQPPYHGVLRFLRRVAPEVRVAILTSSSDEEAKQRLLAEGANAIIPKPLVADVFIDTISKLLAGDERGGFHEH